MGLQHFATSQKYSEISYTLDKTQNLQTIPELRLQEGQELNSFKLIHYIPSTRETIVVRNNSAVFERATVTELQSAGMGDTYYFEDILTNVKWNPKNIAKNPQRIILNVVIYDKIMPVEPVEDAKRLFDIFPEIEDDSVEVVSFTAYLCRLRQDVIEVHNEGGLFNELLLKYLKSPKRYDKFTITHVKIKSKNNGRTYLLPFSKVFYFK